MALTPQTFPITRTDLVRYAGASGDFNPIHWSDRVATGVGLPGVIAHGMLTMALTSRAVTAWVGGDPGAIVEYQVRFTRPIVVPDDDTGTELIVSATVRRVEDPALAQLDLTAICAGEKVLAQARAIVRADAGDIPGALPAT
jgi:acyl dehydratase